MTPELISLLAWAPFALFALIFGIAFTILGFRRGSIKAGISVAVTVISAALSVLAARLLSGVIVSSLMGMIMPEEGGVAINPLFETEHFGALIQGVSAAVVALVLFIPCFLILLAILKNLTSLVFTAKIPKPKHVGNKLGGLAIGLVDALLVAFLLLLPIYGTLHMGGNLMGAIAVLSAPEAPEQNETVSIPVTSLGTNGGTYRPLSAPVPVNDGGETEAPSYVDLVDAICHTPLAEIAGLPLFTSVYDSMATFTHDGETVSVTKTVNTVSQVVTAVASYTKNEEGSSQTMLGALNHLEKVMTESSFFAGLACDVAQVTLADNEMLGAYGGFSDKTVLQEDMSAIFTLARSAVENEILPVFFEEEIDLSQVELGSFPQDMASVLNSTESLAQLKADLINTVIDTALKGVAGDDEAKLEELRASVGSVSSAPLTGDDLKAEGDSLALILSAATQITNASDSAAAGAMAGNLIEGLARHPSFGVDKVVDVAGALLGMGGEDGAGNSEEALKETIKDALNASISKPVGEATFGDFVGTTVGAAELFSKIMAGEADPAAMEQLLSAKPEVLKQLEETLTGELLGALGVAGEESEIVTSLVSAIFGTIRQTELTEAERKTEAVAISDVLTTVFTLSQTADMEATVNKLVQDYLNSKIFCTAAKTMTANGSDPLGFNLDNASKKEIRQVLLDKIAELNDATATEKLGYLAAFIGVELN